jgi:hypothetical protein
MQAATTAPPAQLPLPPLPTIEQRGPTSITITGSDGSTQTLQIPLTRQDIAEIRAQRRELSNQLTSAEDRRHRLAEEILKTPTGASRSGLEQRMAVLDKRIVQLESDIAATGRQISAAPAGLTTSTESSRGGDMPDNVAAMTGAIIVFVFFPIALAISRWIWKRSGKGPAVVAQLPAETGQRLERLEQGVEAIAIEIERIAEGQRFVTKILSEGKAPERIGAAREG